MLSEESKPLYVQRKGRVPL